MKKRYLLYCLFLTIIFTFPLIISEKLYIGHDTFFHLSRIEGYSTALLNLDIFPKIYFFKNLGFGYASPTFYNDIFLILPSILYLLNFPLSVTYKITVFIVTFLSALSMFYLVKKISRYNNAPYIAALVYTFSNYHLTDAYVRGALGELFAFVFLPLIINGIYELLYCSNNWKILCFSFMGLFFSHNISFLFGLFILIIFSIVNVKNKIFLKNVLIAGFVCFILCIWYLIPLIEGIKANNLYVNYYKNISLKNTLMPLDSLLENKIIFALGYTNAKKFMNVNVGFFLLVFPLFYLISKDKNNFIVTCSIIGYIFVILTLNIIPLQIINLFSIIQFAWRFNIISMVLLSLGSSVIFCKLKNKKLMSIIIIVLILESIVNLTSVVKNSIFINNKTTYNDIITGKIVDPFYGNSFFARIEIAAADYLPVNSPDFKNYQRFIYDDQGNLISNSFKQEYNNFKFKINKKGVIVLPITYYKGYYVYKNKTKINTFASKEDLVSFNSLNEGEYTLIYEGTIIQKVSLLISISGWIIFILNFSPFKKFLRYYI